LRDRIHWFDGLVDLLNAIGLHFAGRSDFAHDISMVSVMRPVLAESNLCNLAAAGLLKPHFSPLSLALVGVEC
jgi:hypothetical protein